MKQKILPLFIAFFVMIFTSGCDSERANILFNKHPFNSQSIISESNTNIFRPEERIYYLITFPERIESKSLLIQVYKIGGESDERLGYELVWGNRVKLRDEQVHYYTSYIVLNKKGAYHMEVYSRDNPTRALTSANFFIKD